VLIWLDHAEPFWYGLDVMCALCLRQPFFSHPGAKTDLASLREKALQVKADIRLYEAELDAQLKRGDPPCLITVAVLSSLKEEQYQIAQKI
jgi:hypothetical protein